MCFARCRFLIKTVPLGCNWCYLRLGQSPYGRGARSQSEMVSGQGDRKPLCNLVRLEMAAAIRPTGLNCTCLLLLLLDVGICSTLYIKRAQLMLWF